MPDGIHMEVYGDKEVRYKLDKLADTEQRRAVRPALSKGLTPVNKTAKQNAKSVSKTVSKAIGKRVKSYSTSGVVWGAVGVRNDNKWVKPVSDDYYWGNIDVVKPIKIAHLLEFGTDPHESPYFGGGHHPGTDPHPFLRPAWDMQHKNGLNIMRKDVMDNIEKILRTL